MFDMFNTPWAELRDHGVITGEEYAATNVPQCYRTVDEFTAPLADPEGAGVPCRPGARTRRYRVVRCPFAVAFGEHGDPARFAHGSIPTLRSWSEATFAATGAIPARSAGRFRPILTDSHELRVRTSSDGRRSL